jgi:acylphosphatase
MTATRAGLSGYARNRPDGSVEVLAEGPKGDLRKFLTWLKIGPSSSRVERVDHRYLPYSGSYESFTARY